MEIYFCVRHKTGKNTTNILNCHLSNVKLKAHQTNVDVEN